VVSFETNGLVEQLEKSDLEKAELSKQVLDLREKADKLEHMLLALVPRKDYLAAHEEAKRGTVAVCARDAQRRCAACSAAATMQSVRVCPSHNASGMPQRKRSCSRR
jgi:hypothetical protein